MSLYHPLVREGDGFRSRGRAATAKSIAPTSAEAPPNVVIRTVDAVASPVRLRTSSLEL